MGAEEDWRRVREARRALVDGQTRQRELIARASEGDEDAFVEVLRTAGDTAVLFAAWRDAMKKALS